MIKNKMVKQHGLGVILSLAGPTMMEQLLNTAVQYIDTAMVGSLGTQATAAVGSTGTVNWLINSTISAAGVGFLALISQACGEGNLSKARRASAQSVLAVLFCGIFFTILTLGLSSFIPVWMQVEANTRQLASRYFFILYSPMLFRTATIIFGTVLRAAGDTKAPMRVGIWVNVINVVLNALLIYPTREIFVCDVKLLLPGVGWGVYGAAVASAISFVVGGTAITCILWKHPKISPRGLSILPDRQILRPCLLVALPNAMQRFGTSFGYVVFASMINSLGDISTAAHTIANTVESAFYIPAYGMQTAAATLAGNALGERNENKLKTLAFKILCIEIFLMLLSGGLLFLVAPGMVRLFSKETQVILLGCTVLRMVALSEPFYGVSIIIEGMLQGMGRTIFPLIINLSGMWLIRIIGTFICIHWGQMGLISAWSCMIGHNMFLFLVYGFYYLSGKWNPMRNKVKIEIST